MTLKATKNSDKPINGAHIERNFSGNQVQGFPSEPRQTTSRNGGTADTERISIVSGTDNEWALKTPASPSPTAIYLDLPRTMAGNKDTRPAQHTALNYEADSVAFIKAGSRI
jgi:hypothetical protein